MRRGLSFCLMLVMILTMAWVPVSAEEQPAKIEIRTPEVLPKAGEEFEVVAYISNNPGIKGIQFDLFAENGEVECKEIILGEMLTTDAVGGVNPSAPVGARITVISSPGLFEEDGLLATYKFVAKEDIESFDVLNITRVSLLDVSAEKLPYIVEGLTEVFLPEPSRKPKGDKAENSLDEQDEVEEEPILEHLFADTAGHWAEKYINAATEKSLFKGNADGTFLPEDNVTRAQFVAVLWRMAGSPTVDVAVPFVDIENQSEEFKKAIAWGYNSNFINGTSEATFEPEGSLTREAAMKILHYYSGGQSGTEMMFAPVYNGYFQDSGQISDWAEPSMWWGVYYKLISGTTQTTISPQDTTTRAQLAKILVNYINSTHINN